MTEPVLVQDDEARRAARDRLAAQTILRGGPGVDSDLRFAIHDALAEEGIAIAFTQRDVHLDVPRALRELAGRMGPDATRLAEGGGGAAASGRGHA